jgi:phage gpG-like protein
VFQFDISGLTELGDGLKAAVERVNLATKTATIIGANTIKKNAQTGLALRSHAKGTPTPSPPGDAPALVSGALRRSITVKDSSYSGMYAAEIGPTIIYGRIQELGGIAGRGHHAHLPARPYLRPALEFSLPAIAEAYRAAWSSAMGV